MTDWQILRMVELPLAARTILAGLRVATVTGIGVATVATLIGAGGLPSSISSWYWDFADGNNTSDQNPIHSWDSAGYYNVMLIVEDDNGCIDTVTNEIIVFLPPFIPTGFSPNGDITNSVLYVLGGPFKELQFDIYNNWGEIIFTSVEQATGWDGTYKSAPQPMGVYVYTVKAITLDDVEHKLAGDVTLIR
jgi:gliding motility-associated-like protein